LGIAFPPHELLDPARVEGKVLIVPPGAARSRTIRAIGSLRRAIVSGWALDPSARYRYGVDAAFPVSDHADYPDLLKTVDQVSPKEVWTLHGYASDFAATLREQGCRAFALSEADQLTLGLGI
jgi:DNA ligase-1